MRSILLLLPVILVAGSAMATEWPPDVADFIARRDRCDHFRGEDSEDPARAAEIRRALAANCRGTDAELARLKRRHAGNRAIRARLEGYDPRVE